MTKSFLVSPARVSSIKMQFVLTPFGEKGSRQKGTRTQVSGNCLVLFPNGGSIHSDEWPDGKTSTRFVWRERCHSSIYISSPPCTYAITNTSAADRTMAWRCLNILILVTWFIDTIHLINNQGLGTIGPGQRVWHNLVSCSQTFKKISFKG